MIRKQILNGIFVFIFFGVLAPPVLAASLEDKVGEHAFANGLKLLTVERHTSPTISAYITIGVGSVNETSENRGVAHLLEHMLFKGTTTLGTSDYCKERPLLLEIEKTAEKLDALLQAKSAEQAQVDALREKLSALQKEHKQYVVKDEFSRIYSENGGTGYNAFTSKDLTTYIISLPSNKLELWAAIEADRMKNPVLREFYTERDVVMEERRRSYESRPEGRLYETLIQTAFTVHPYRHPVIGWSSDIRTLSLKETRDFLQKYYAPINTVIALVGDFDTDEAVGLVEKYFGNIAPGTPVPPITAIEPEQKAEKRVDINFDAEPRLAIAFHKPTLPDKHDYVFDLISQILTEGRTSRLYRSLVYEKELVTKIDAYGAPGSRYDNLFVISAVPRFPHTAEEVEKAIYEELERLAAEPVSSEELEKARNGLRADQLRYLKSNQGLAQMLTYYQTVAGNWRYVVDYDQKVAALTAEDVMAAAKEFFTKDNRTVAILRRGGER